jgi:hypothetical protein
MQGLFAPHIWHEQPQCLADIDWGNPLTKGLQLAFHAPSKRDVVKQQKFVTSAGALKPTRKGVGYEVLGSSTVASLSSKTFPSTTASSAFVLLDHGSISTGTQAILGRGEWAASANFIFYFNDVGSLVVQTFDGGGASAAIGALKPAGIHSYAYSHSGTSVTGYVDGVYSGNATYSLTVPVGSLSWLIGASSDDYLNENMLGKYLLALVWARQLSAPEQQSLSHNPWQIFKPAPRFFFNTASGSPPQLLAPTGQLAGSTWAASNGGSLYTCVDESSPDEADWTYTTTADAWEEFTFPDPDSSHNGSAAGGYVKYRIPAGSGAITVDLKQGTSVLETWGPHTLTGTLQAFAQPITVTTSNSSDLRVRFTAS